MQYKMKFFGSLVGRKSGKKYRFSKDDIIEAEAGEFDELSAEILDDSSKRTVEREGKEVETASLNPKHEKRKRRK